MDKGFAVLKIDPEFKTLIWPLRKEEYLQLEVNLTIDGCRDPIITWNNIIIDGHKHRLTRAHREKQLKMSCQALHNAPPNRT